MALDSQQGGGAEPTCTSAVRVWRGIARTGTRPDIDQPRNAWSGFRLRGCNACRQGELVSRAVWRIFLALLCASCAPKPTASSTNLGAVGSINVGMSAEALQETIKASGLEVKCKDEEAFTVCQTVHRGLMGLRYELMSGRVISAARFIAATDTAAAMNSLRAFGATRYGPQLSNEAPAVSNSALVQHWYGEAEHVYRVHLCGSVRTLHVCSETSFEATPASVGARLMSEVWSQRDATRVICRSWDEVIGYGCKDSTEKYYVGELGSGEVLRIALLPDHVNPSPQGRPLFETRTFVHCPVCGPKHLHYRMWRRSDGHLYGIGCQNIDGDQACWEVVTRYEPLVFLKKIIESG